jgi:hypothetical protein
MMRDCASENLEMTSAKQSRDSGSTRMRVVRNDELWVCMVSRA